MNLSVLATASLPDDSALREKVREVLSRSGYHTQTPDAGTDWWMELWIKLTEWVLRFLFWVWGTSEGLPFVLRVLIVVVLVVVLVAVVGHISYTLFTALRGETHRRYSLSENVSVRVSAGELETLAEQAAGQGELIEAVRFLFRACLIRLEEREKRLFRRGTTNREHLRKYRGTPFFVPLEALVLTIELKWFGEEVCDNGDYQACRRAHREVVSILREPVRADAT